MDTHFFQHKWQCPWNKSRIDNSYYLARGIYGPPPSYQTQVGYSNCYGGYYYYYRCLPNGDHPSGIPPDSAPPGDSGQPANGGQADGQNGRRW